MTATKILVVEDNPANMKLAVLLLGSAGYQVLQAPDAESGLALARHELPDLVLMDVQLPGMDGLSAARRLKADTATRNIKVLAVTGMAMKGDEEKIRAAGCDGYLPKPVSRDALLDAVARIVQGGASSR